MALKISQANALTVLAPGQSISVEHDRGYTLILWSFALAHC
jgi:hypothetical protein